MEYLDAEEGLKEWISICNGCVLNEFEEADKTIRNRLPYIVNSFIDETFSYGFIE